MQTDTRQTRGRGALVGLLASGAAFGVAQAVAVTLDAPSPVVAVAQTAIDRAPGPVREWAIRTLGESDKTALIIGIATVLLIASAVIGIVGLSRTRAALAVTAALGLVGVAASTTGRYDTWRFTASLPSVVAMVVAVGALGLLYAALRSAEVPTDEPAQVPVAVEPTDVLDVSPSTLRDTVGRRRFLVAAVAVGAIGTGGVLVGYGRSVRPIAGDFVVPRPMSPAPPLPVGVSFDNAGLSSFHTVNRAFYRVDTAAQLPRIDLASWRLRVHGMVDRELILSFDDLLDRDLIERDITLTCVSNEVGGPYVGNARWIGAPLADLLREAGMRTGADALKSTAVDGFTVGTPLAALTDGRDAMIAIAMNGQPLPSAHGSPARLVVPGLYGYVSATKWVTDLEVTRFADFTAYWTSRGWAEQAPIKTAARIDHPRQGAYISVGATTVGGVAWAQNRGIERVEIRVDDGPWADTELAAEATIDTWRQWRFTCDVAEGQHQLQVRATDRTGAVQTQDEVGPVPDGATGWHALTVFALAGVPTAPFEVRTPTSGPAVL